MDTESCCGGGDQRHRRIGRVTANLRQRQKDTSVEDFIVFSAVRAVLHVSYYLGSRSS
jgi:hypothetical protein